MSEAAAPPSPALPPLRDIIQAFRLDARRKLGQHFLLDENLTAKIVRQAGDLAGRHVVEIGPGPGGLTRALLASPASSVTAVELDPRAADAIRSLQFADPDRLRLIEADALAIDISSLVPAPRQIVANLPYNVATPLLIGWLRQAARWDRMTLMFQLEVAERICAAPDTEAYGRLAVLAQFVCSATLMMRVPASAFSPPPKVVSAVVGLVPHPHQPDPHLFRALERVTAAAFGQRRKMLRRSMANLGGVAGLERAGIAPERRAETLTVAEFERLTLAIGALPQTPSRESVLRTTGGEPPTEPRLP